MSDQTNVSGEFMKPPTNRIGFDLNSREELIRTYTEKEINLTEKLEKDRLVIKNFKMEARALKQYARQLKYLAEDWAPVGVPLPEVLSKPPPAKLDDETVTANGKI